MIISPVKYGFYYPVIIESRADSIINNLTTGYKNIIVEPANAVTEGDLLKVGLINLISDVVVNSVISNVSVGSINLTLNLDINTEPDEIDYGILSSDQFYTHSIGDEPKTGYIDITDEQSVDTIADEIISGVLKVIEEKTFNSTEKPISGSVADNPALGYLNIGEYLIIGSIAESNVGFIQVTNESSSDSVTDVINVGYSEPIDESIVELNMANTNAGLIIPGQLIINSGGEEIIKSGVILIIDEYSANTSSNVIDNNFCNPVVESETNSIAGEPNVSNE